MKSLRSRLIIIFSVLILILFTIVIIISVSLSSNSLSNMAESNLSATLSSDLYAIRRIIRDDYGQLRYENNHLLKANGESIEGDYELIDELGDSLHVVVTIFEKDGNDFRRVTTNIVKDNGERAVNTYLGVDSGAFEDVSNGVTYEGKADILGKTYLTVYEPIMQDGAVVGITFVGIEETEAAAIINESMSALLQWMIIVAILMMLVAIAVTTFISNMITKPIKSVVDNTNQLASYDLTTIVDDKWIKRKDEIGVLAKATDALITNLRQLVSEVAQNSEQVAATAEELTATSQQSATSSEEVAETIQEIANGATEQAENASVGSDKLAELSRLVEADRQHIELMEQSTDNVSQLVNDGLGISDQLANKTKQNNEASGYVYDSILKTNTSSEKIGEASNVIAAIAQQTNLLALNAAIEAARAGEAGKGFSVVADEIRKLAEQSTASTQRIDEMVSTLKEDAGLAVSKMQEAAEIVKEQEESVAKTIDKYNEIAKAMATSEKVVEELTTSAQLMEARKDDVQSSIESLSAVAEENAASTEEASAAIEEQTASVEEIANASEGLSRLSIELQQLIEKFKL